MYLFFHPYFKSMNFTSVILPPGVSYEFTKLPTFKSPLNLHESLDADDITKIEREPGIEIGLGLFDLFALRWFCVVRSIERTR